MDYVDSDCCSNDYVDIDEHLESWEQRFRSVYCELTVIFGSPQCQVLTGILGEKILEFCQMNNEISCENYW